MSYRLHSPGTRHDWPWLYNDERPALTTARYLACKHMTPVHVIDTTPGAGDGDTAAWKLGPTVSRQEDALAEQAEHLQTRLTRTLVALRAAHDEEGVCSCPFDRCVLSEKWAQQWLKAKDHYDRVIAPRLAGSWDKKGAEK